MTIKEVLNVGFPKTEAMKKLQVVNPGTNDEWYIDNRTEADTNFNYTVQPVTANSVAYVICCPNCGKLHPFPVGWSEELASNLWEDHVVVPELLEYDEDGKHFQITVTDWYGVTNDNEPERKEAALAGFARSDNPKVKEAYNLLFPELNYADSIDSDAAQADFTR